MTGNRGNRKYPARNIRTRVAHTERPTDHFSQVPNAMCRGDESGGFDYRDLSSAERLLLIAGLSCRDGFECTLDVVDSWIGDFGRDKREEARRGLREKGYLTMSQVWIPEGEPGAGDFSFWEMRFYMLPIPPEQRDALKPKAPKVPRKRASYGPAKNRGVGPNEADGAPDAAREGAAGDSEPWMPGQATEDQPSDGAAGNSQPWMPGQAHGPGPEPWQSGPGRQGSNKEEENQQKKPPTHPTPPDLQAGSVAEPGGRVGDQPEDSKAQAVLQSVLEEAGATRGQMPYGRSRTRILEKIQRRIDEGWSPLDLEMVLAGSGEGANDIVAVMNFRLDDIAGAPPPPRLARPAPAQRRPRPTRCANPDCDTNTGGTGLVESDTEPGRVRPCPDCRPDAYEKPLRRMAGAGSHP